MKCPVCHKKADTHLYHCASCGKYVHEKCWKEHCAAEHRDEE